MEEKNDEVGVKFRIAAKMHKPYCTVGANVAAGNKGTDPYE